MSDDIFRLPLPRGAEIIGYANDLAVLMTASTIPDIREETQTVIRRIERWLGGKNLWLIYDKTELLLVTGKRKLPPLCIEIGGREVTPSRTLKYLGVPRLLGSVIHSILLYAAPVWRGALETEKSRTKFAGAHRLIALRLGSAYRTLSYEATLVVAGIPPIELLAKEREEVFEGASQTNARNRLWESWQAKWETTEKARWTRALVGNVRNWVERRHGEVNYHLTQTLTGHGCFTEYLYDNGKAQSWECPYCGVVDDMGHTLFRCLRWEEARRWAKTADGTITVVTERTMVKTMLEPAGKWEALEQMVGEIIHKKERERRELAPLP